MLIPNPSPATSCRFNRNSHSYKKKRERCQRVSSLCRERASIQNTQEAYFLQGKIWTVFEICDVFSIKKHSVVAGSISVQ